MMPSDGIQDMRFDKVYERQARAKVAGELNYRPREFWTRIGRVSSSRNPRSQCRRRYQRVPRSFCEAIAGLLFGDIRIEFWFADLT
jgi:hypothetical protein